MRSKYWTCSKFADWVRGTAKLPAGTVEEWDSWHTTAKMRSNFRYWLAEEGLDHLQTAVMYIPDKIYALKYYVNNRFITHTHQLTAHARDITPGTWCDVGNRFLPCLFNELVEFVEVELAWSHIAWGSEEDKAKYKAPFWATGWFRWRTWRCPQAGLDHLAWEMSLKYDEDWMDKDDPKIGQPTPQAINAKEKLDLYTWWTVTRPARPDPYDASGWSAHCDELREANGNGVLAMFRENNDPKLKKAGDKALKLLHKLEAQYEKEDEDMMIRLIKVRHGLWT
jgi:hypothetical protein